MANLILPKKYDFTVGADPEFCCIDGRTVVESADHTNDNETFGCDGNGITFEVRPQYSLDPIEVVGNIHDIFVRKTMADPKFLRYNWKAGSFYADFPLGGHIHFGIRGDKISPGTAVNILDNYVGAITVLIENRNQGLRRRSHDYGRMGDFRQQDHGFEYRTCSSWLTSPYISSAVLSLAKAVMYEVTNNPNFTPRAFVTDEDFHGMKVERINEHFADIWRDITHMELYQTYKPYIDLLYFLVTKKLSWFPSSNLKEAWGLVDLTSAYANKIKLNVIWERYNQQAIAAGLKPQIIDSGIDLGDVLAYAERDILNH